ncbi:MAG: acetolactate synthase small subunit [Myxococcales bacterium]|nr:acetolactate synthase small subunit [Myxococcales bacterium]
MANKLETISPDHAHRHVLSILVENQYGVLSRIAGMFATRGFNIDSLTVSATEDSTMSRMTIAVHGDSSVISQLQRQLDKFAEVIVIEKFTERQAHISRELMLVKVRHKPTSRTDLLQIASIFKAKSVDMTPSTITFEIVGKENKLSNFLTVLQEESTIIETARSGVVALTRGKSGLRESFLGEVVNQ